MNSIEKNKAKQNIIKCEKALNAIKENKKEYKFELDYKKMWEDLVDKSLDLQEEYRELKLQNLELRNIYFNVTHINKIYTKELNRYIDKHQKFIKYLEDMLDDENDIFSVVRVKDVLQKYRRITGDDK